MQWYIISIIARCRAGRKWDPLIRYHFQRKALKNFLFLKKKCELGNRRLSTCHVVSCRFCFLIRKGTFDPTATIFSTRGNFGQRCACGSQKLIKRTWYKKNVSRLGWLISNGYTLRKKQVIKCGPTFWPGHVAANGWRCSRSVGLWSDKLEMTILPSFFGFVFVFLFFKLVISATTNITAKVNLGWRNVK